MENKVKMSHIQRWFLIIAMWAGILFLHRKQEENNIMKLYKVSRVTILIIGFVFILFIFSQIIIQRLFGKHSLLKGNSAYFLTNEADYYIYDNIAGHVHKPYAIREYKWQE